MELNIRKRAKEKFNIFKSQKIISTWQEKEKVEEENLQDKDQYPDHPRQDCNSQ